MQIKIQKDRVYSVDFVKLLAFLRLTVCSKLDIYSLDYAVSQENVPRFSLRIT